VLGASTVNPGSGGGMGGSPDSVLSEDAESPSLPNAGAGGEALQTVLSLLVSAAVVVVGTRHLMLTS
jgi:hypothetical protein